MGFLVGNPFWGFCLRFFGVGTGFCGFSLGFVVGFCGFNFGFLVEFCGFRLGVGFGDLHSVCGWVLWVLVWVLWG